MARRRRTRDPRPPAKGSQPSRHPSSPPRATPPTPPAPNGLAALRPLLTPFIAIELFLLALMAVSPIGGVSQTISPLARTWPWLLAPARLIFGNALVDTSIPAERGWPALALFAILLVGASCAAVALTRARSLHVNKRLTLALILGSTALLGV